MDDGAVGFSRSVFQLVRHSTHSQELQCKMPCRINASDSPGCDVAVKIQSHGRPR